MRFDVTKTTQKICGQIFLLEFCICLRKNLGGILMLFWVLRKSMYVGNVYIGTD